MALYNVSTEFKVEAANSYDARAWAKTVAADEHWTASVVEPTEFTSAECAISTALEALQMNDPDSQKRVIATLERILECRTDPDSDSICDTIDRIIEGDRK